MKRSITDPFRLACLLLAAPFCAPAAEFVVINQDTAGFGFNDPAVVAPVGGNSGTTLGQQRLNVLQRAGDIWSGYLASAVPIRVQARFQNLGGTPDGYTLAGASVINFIRDFSNAPRPLTWYPVALANSLAGTDLDPSGNDINVTINIAPDTDPLLDDYYYGFDGNAPPDQTDLLDVLLHELGHGLGFTSLVDIGNGQYTRSYPDIYTTNLFDTEVNLSWTDMNGPGRKASAKNDPNLVWTGPYSTAASLKMLAPDRSIEVASGPAAGTYSYIAASFGPPVPPAGILGTLVPVNDGVAPVTDACDPIQNAAALIGNIAYIDRGSCNFDAKVLSAQQNGAIAVIIANNVTGGPIGMSGSDIVDGTPLTIPAVGISLEDGQALLAASPGVVLNLGVAGATLAGTDGGFVRIYAPNPVEQGSSVSHWSTAATPDLLMEPFINPVLREDLDLSLTLLKDIGWMVLDIPFPYLSYDLWVDETFSPGATLTGQNDDPDGDGMLNVEEFFFGGDPEAPSNNLLPRMELTGPDLEMVYTRSTKPADLTYGYEVSTDMVTWSDAVEGVDYIEELVASLGGGAEQVRLRLIPPAGGTRVFVQVRIEGP